MVLLRPKADEVNELVENFGSYWDKKAYEEIDRADPELLGLIENLVHAKKSPDQIKRLVLQRAPQRWPESRQVEQAARWVARGQG